MPGGKPFTLVCKSTKRPLEMADLAPGRVVLAYVDIKESFDLSDPSESSPAATIDW
jgi:hypothetical protein